MPRRSNVGRRDNEKPCEREIKIHGSYLAWRLDAAIQDIAELGDEKLVRDVIDSLVFLDHAAVAGLSTERKVLLDRTIRETLEGEYGVRKVYALEDFDGAYPSDHNDSDSRLAALVCASTTGTEPRHGDYYIVTEPGSFVATSPYVVSHGSPYLYDRAVALLVRYPGGKGGVEVEEATSFRSFTGSLWYALTGESSLADGHPMGVR